jgi:myo-inositol 2-dehydrogenase / D-chiro-inositol 1-dehydrogenase
VSGPQPPVRIGLLGAGRIGRLHADLLAGRVEGAALAAVCDADPEAAAEVAARLRVPAVASGPELFGHPDVDAIAICTSTDTHAEAIVAAARTGKAIFCEKPVALDLGEIDRALAAVDESGALFQVGFNRRFDPGHASVREAVSSGAIGDVHVVRISSRDPAPPPLEYARTSGGLFLDMTIHDFDMARFVTGSEVVEVYARGGVRITPELVEFGDVDTAVATLLHENGALTVIDNSRQAVYGFDQRVEAFGSRGVAASENPLAHSGVLRTADGTRAAALPYFFVERYLPSYVAQWEAFARAVRSGGTSPVTGADGRAPLAIGLAAWRSHRERRPVSVAEIA